MQAITLRGFGGPDRLEFGNVPDPAPRAGWEVVRLEYAGLNWHDVLLRKGVYDARLPVIPGADGAGTLASTGEKVLIYSSLNWGDRQRAAGPEWEILGDRTDGTYAELVAVPREAVFPRPNGYSAAESSVLAVSGLTAFRGLRKAEIEAGDWVLVRGASGGVSAAAVGLGCAMGAHIVVTSSNVESGDWAVAAGAQAAVDHTAPDWQAAARAQTPSARGFDIVLDAVGLWQDTLALLRDGGRAVVFGASVAQTSELAIRPFYFGQHSLLGTALGSPRDMADYLAVINELRVPAPHIDSVFPLDRPVEAHQALEAGRVRGKIVIRVS